MTYKREVMQRWNLWEKLIYFATSINENAGSRHVAILHCPLIKLPPSADQWRFTNQLPQENRLVKPP
jgi:hypothetical protein